mgnify:CR=1 FL=1
MAKSNKKEDDVTLYLEEQDLKRKAEDIGFLVQDWYDKIKDFTTETIFLDLSHEDRKSTRLNSSH